MLLFTHTSVRERKSNIYVKTSQLNHRYLTEFISTGKSILLVAYSVKYKGKSDL